MKPKYIIIHSFEPHIVQREVNEFLKEGFKTKGKLRIKRTGGATANYTQVMVKIPIFRARNPKEFGE